MSAATVTLPPRATTSPAGVAPPASNPLGLPPQALRTGLRRFSVHEYEALIRAGILGERERVELLDGYLVNVMSRNPPHDSAVMLLSMVLPPLLPVGWTWKAQGALTLAASVPEPDFLVARGDRRSFVRRHPTAAEVGLVVEAADSSLVDDRADKGRRYAAAGIPEYWIVNLVDGQVEVYTQPQPAADPPQYAARQDYKPGDVVPLTLDGTTAAVPVADLLP